MGTTASNQRSLKSLFMLIIPTTVIQSYDIALLICLDRSPKSQADAG
jgi:hypothetical protein